MSSEVFNLAIILSLKDAASGGLDRFQAKLRAAEKDGKQFAETLDDIRDEMNKGLAIGGVGIAGLGLMYQGVRVAADFQSSVTDLRSTFSQLGKDGKVNLDVLGKDMLKAEAIATRLGNALPGTTEDVLRAIQTLKQNGLQTETILNGAAEAVYNLAVANDELPTETAKNFAQFGQLFKLKPDEFKSAADTFSRLFTSSGIGSSELIEAVKYFQGRSGAALGISGLEDAEKTVRVLGLLRKQGLEGSIAGTSFNNLFSGYLSARNKKDDPLERLKRLEGIDIKLFDNKGDFAGIDNLFKQLEPLQKLTEEKRIGYLKEIFGEEGMSAATAILKTGAQGWQAYNEEQNKTISLQQKNAEKSKDFNNQMEALTGSVKNLVVTGFSPLLPQLTSAINSTNTFVGNLQQFGKENPNLVKTLSTLALYGTTALVVVGGFKAMTSAWKLFTLASSFSRGEGVLQYLQQTNIAANNAGNSIAGATNKAKGFKNSLSAIGNSPITQTVGLVLATAAAEFALTSFIQMMQEAMAKPVELKIKLKEVEQGYDELMGTGLIFRKPGDYGENDRYKPLFDAQAKRIFDAMNVDNDLVDALHPERTTWWEYLTNPNPFGVAKGQHQNAATLDPEVFAQRMEKAGGLKLYDPNQLASLLEFLKKGGGTVDGTPDGKPNLNINDFTMISAALEKHVGKDKMKAATDILNQRTGNQPPPQPKPFNELFSPFPKNSFFPQNNPFEKKPLFEQKNPFGQTNFDISKPANQFFTSIEKLNQPVGLATQAFNNFQLSGSEWQNSLLQMRETTDTTKQSVVDFSDLINKANTQLPDLIKATTNASGGLNTLGGKLANWQPPTPQIQWTLTAPSGATPNSTFTVPPNAAGGLVRGKGLAYIHSDEEIIPAEVSRKYSGGLRGAVENIGNKSSGGQPINITFSPTINVHGGGKDVGKQVANELRKFVKYDLDREMAKIMDKGRQRS